MPAPSPDPQPSAARNIYAFGITSFLNDTATEMAYWVLPAFLVSLGAGPAQLGLIEGLAESVASFAKLFSGYLDRSHRPAQAARGGRIFRRQRGEAVARVGHGVVAHSADPVQRPAGQGSARGAARCDGRRIGVEGAARIGLRSDPVDGFGGCDRRAAWPRWCCWRGTESAASSGRLRSRGAVRDGGAVRHSRDRTPRNRPERTSDQQASSRRKLQSHPSRTGCAPCRERSIWF